METVMKLCAALEITPNELLLGTSPEHDRLPANRGAAEADALHALGATAGGPLHRPAAGRTQSQAIKKARLPVPFLLPFLCQGYIVENLLALFDDDLAIREILFGQCCIKSGHLLIVNRNAALLNQALGLRLGRSKLGFDQQIRHLDGTVLVQICLTQLGGRHVLGVAARTEQRLGSIQSLLRLLLAVYHRGQLQRPASL